MSKRHRSLRELGSKCQSRHCEEDCAKVFSDEAIIIDYGKRVYFLRLLHPDYVGVRNDGVRRATVILNGLSAVAIWAFDMGAKAEVKDLVRSAETTETKDKGKRIKYRYGVGYDVPFPSSPRAKRIGDPF